MLRCKAHRVTRTRTNDHVNAIQFSNILSELSFPFNDCFMASLQLRSELKSNQHNLSANIIPSIAFEQVHDEYNILVLRDTLLKYVPRYTLIYLANYRSCLARRCGNSSESYKGGSANQLMSDILFSSDAHTLDYLQPRKIYPHHRIWR